MNIKPVIFRGKLIEGYFVSDDGRVFTDYKIGRCPVTNKFKRVKTPELIPLKPYDKKSKLDIDLTFPEDIFEYKFRSKEKKWPSECTNFCSFIGHASIQTYRRIST